jgi:arylsulfatase A-like enzyme
MYATRWFCPDRLGKRIVKAVNIVLIVVDTLRADHLGAYGYHRDTSPNLCRLTEQGVRFARFFANNNTTHPSFTTLMSGRHPLNHGIVGHLGKRMLDPRVPLLATVLREHGYTTAAVDNLGRWFQRGFERYVPYVFDQRTTTPMWTGEEITALALPLLGELSGTGSPFFLFVHYWDPHSPYLPPPPYDTLFARAAREAGVRGTPADAGGEAGQRIDVAYGFAPLARYLKGWIGDAQDVATVVARYDGEVAYCDSCIGRLLAEIDRLGLRDETLVVVTSDHGESLGEHGIYFDHHGLYDTTLHVPLLLRWPGHVPAGRVVQGVAQHVDLAPTLLDLAGLDGALDCEGTSLRGQIEGGAPAADETVLACEATWQSKLALRRPGWKLIRALLPDEYGRPSLELYDLTRDPAEEHNLAAECPAVVGDLLEELERRVAHELSLGGHTENPMYAEGLTLRGALASAPEEASLRETVIGVLEEQGQLSPSLGTAGQEHVYSEDEEALIEERLSNLGYL